MSKINTLLATSTLFGRIYAARQRRRTLRILESLPEHLRKDIGWSTDRRSDPVYLAN